MTGILMQAIPDLKGMYLCKDEASSLCNVFNTFDDGLEKMNSESRVLAITLWNQKKMNSVYHQNIEMTRFCHSTTAEIVHLFNI